ncbi:MAG: hypothetical protein AB7D27_15255 [Desulfomicrobium sp.]
MKTDLSTARRLCAVLGIVLGAMLLFSAYCSSRFTFRDVEFVLKSPLMDPWARTWLWRGDRARFHELDITGAVDAYWRGVGRNPLLFEGWFALARLERQRGRDGAGALHDFLLRAPLSTAWRWQQLLLAVDRQDGARFAQTFNDVLCRLAGHRQEAVEVALGFWGGWNEILGHTDCGNRWTLFRECMARQAVDACLGMYPFLETGCGAWLEDAQRSELIEFLMRHRRWAEAVEVGRRGGLFREGPVTNGGFDAPLGGAAFGWRLSRVEGVEARREPGGASGAGHAVRFRFLGTANLRYGDFWQYVPLRPGTRYELRFFWKARRLTTDQGLYVEVRGEGCRGFSVRSPAITGSRNWSEERVAFDVPDGCPAASVRLKRDRSLKFDAKIAGDVWLDNVELVEKTGPR